MDSTADVPDGVVDAVRRLRDGELTSVALTKAMLARIRATDDGVGAWAHVDPEIALAAARSCDARRARGGERGALEGIGIGVKDIIDTSDMPTALGSPIHAGRQPTIDAECIARLRHAGGFALGKTVTTEFAFMQPGKTRNPWNTAHTPGGSSSGSAAAVALRQCGAALATQTNGSIVRPAAYCGVAGFKPTSGTLPYAGIFVFSPTLDTLGVIAGDVDDCAYVASALADDGRIAAAVRLLPVPPRIGVLADFPWVETGAEQARAIQRAIAALRAAGAKVDEIAFPHVWRDAQRVHRCIMLHEGARELGPTQGAERARMSEELNRALDEGRRIDEASYAEAMRARQTMIAATAEVLAGCDALLSPPVPGPAPRDLSQTGDPACCTLWTLLGTPSIAIPVARAANGLPLGIQLSAQRGDDDALLAVAKWCEPRFERIRLDPAVSQRFSA
ncbi:MAG: amidase [Betaproteobacteria bacterium]